MKGFSSAPASTGSAVSPEPSGLGLKQVPQWSATWRSARWFGNSSGLRLPAAFYRDHPQFAGAAGHVEVLDNSTLLLRMEPEEQQQGEAEEDTLMLGLFLDFLSRQALTSDQGPVLYTEAMAADDDELLAGVLVEAADEPLGA